MNRVKTGLAGAYLVCFAVAGAAGAGNGRVLLDLESIERAGLERSGHYGDAREEAQAWRRRAEARESLLYPRLSLDASFRYMTAVAELETGVPGMGARPLGDNENYSLGPTLNWTLWDGGALRKAWNAARSAAEAKEREAESSRRRVVLAARRAYFQVTLSGEQVTLLSDALRLVEKQYEDIRINVKAGAKSRMDELSARQEVLSRRQQLSQARSELAGALRELESLTGETYCPPGSMPFDARVAGPPPAGTEPAVVFVATESIERLLGRFERYRSARVEKDHPNLSAGRAAEESSRLAAESAKAALLPRVQVSVRSSLDYPNGPRLESVQQNMGSVSLSWPLFERGLSRKRAGENERLSLAAGARTRQAEADLERDWRSTLDRLTALGEQRRIAEETAAGAEELAGIVYRSYASGGLTYLEVQNANFRAIEARIQLAKTKVQILINLAVMASIAE